MASLDLRLPQTLIPRAILDAHPAIIEGRYFVAILAGGVLDLGLPRDPTRGDWKRFSVKGICDGWYLASTPKTAVHEAFDLQNESLRLDLYEVELSIDQIFDLRPPEIQTALDLSRDCFRLANPALREHKTTSHGNISRMQFGLPGSVVLFGSPNAAGDCLCLYRGSRSRFIRQRLIERYINVSGWLRDN